MANIKDIKQKLNLYKDGYDLCGVEITDEDAENTIALINNGYTEDNAINEVLSNINEVLSNDF